MSRMLLSARKSRFWKSWRNGPSIAVKLKHLRPLAKVHDHKLSVSEHLKMVIIIILSSARMFS